MASDSRDAGARGEAMHAPPTSDDEEPIKIILLGDSATGKSKLVERYLVDNYAQHQLSTYALTLFRKDVVIDGQSYHIDFWDTAGQERFQSLHPSYYHRAHACIFCFDVTRKITYKNLVTWYKELREYRKNIPCICVANKVDVDMAVTSKAFGFPEKHHMPLFMCSAADGTNVVQAFDAAVNAAIECSKRPPDDFYEDVMALLAESSVSDPAKKP